MKPEQPCPKPGSQIWCAKQDSRPQKDWWAPGEYLQVCFYCREYFFGDKRAAHCADCAYDETRRKRDEA